MSPVTARWLLCQRVSLEDGAQDLECATRNRGCDALVTCTNSPGSFKCGNYGDITFSPTFSVTGAALMRVPVAGGTPTRLAASVDDLHGLVVDANYVYYTSRSESEVRKVPKAGGTPIVLATGLDFPFQIVQTASSLYWTNYSSSAGAILRLAK